MPLRGMKKTLVQGLAVGLGAGFVARALRKRKAKEPTPIDCYGVGGASGTIEGITYLETMRGGAQPGDRVPMVVVFHSRGAPPTGAASFPAIKGPARIIRPEGPRSLGNLPTWFELPSKTQNQAEWSRQMEETGAQVARFLAAITACRPTAGLPLVTGSSEGGHMAYLMASRYPSLVRGGVAVLGYLAQPLWNARMAPTVGLHGTQDTAVPYARTQAYWDAMKSQGAALSTQTFNSGHTVSGPIAKAWRDSVDAMLGY